MKRSLIALFCLLTLAGCSQGGQQTACSENEPPVTAFVDVSLVSMTQDGFIQGQAVVVEGTKIVDIGLAAEEAIPDCATVIDGAGAFLMPGLADMHVHSGDGWLDGDIWPVSPPHLYLSQGVTTVRDCGHTGNISLPLHWQDEISAGNLDGPTIYTTGSVMWGDHRGPVHAGIVQEQIDQGFQFLKLKSLTAEDFYGPMAEAKQLGVYTVGHIPTAIGLEGALPAGLDEIAHIEELFWLSLFLEMGDRPGSEAEWPSWIIEATIQLFGTNPGHLSVDDIEAIHGQAISAVVDELRSADVFVGTTLVVDEALARAVLEPDAFLARSDSRYLPQSHLDRIRRGQNKHQVALRGVEALAPLKVAADRLVLMELKDAGIPLLLGTDSGGPGQAIVPGYSIHDELRILTENGFTPYEAIATATANAAGAVEAMTGEGDFGTIKVGNRADLILVEENPLQDVGHIRDPLGVMAAGRWYSGETLAQMVTLEE